MNILSVEVWRHHWHFKLFVHYSNYSNSLEQIALFGICIQSISKFGIQYSVYFQIPNILGQKGQKIGLKCLGLVWYGLAWTGCDRGSI